MDTPQHFRSALNGFRREDVVQYLEYLNAKHSTEVNQLTLEADGLRTRVADLTRQLEEKTEVVDQTEALEALRSQLQQALEDKQSLESLCTELEQQAADSVQTADHNAAMEKVLNENHRLEARCTELEAALRARRTIESATAAPPVEREKSISQQELEAYRRAERAERVANEKATVVYNRANTILEEATGKIDGASNELTLLADKVNAQLKQLQYSVTTGKVALQNAINTLQNMHIETDND